MRLLHNIALFASMQVVVIGSLFGYAVRGHDIDRSITCSAVWCVISVTVWIVMAYRQRYMAMVGFAVAGSVAAVGSQVFYSLGTSSSAPICAFCTLVACGTTAGMWWSDNTRW